MKNNKFKYDVAFSFLKKDKNLALEINSLLKDKTETFIYTKKQDKIAGKKQCYPTDFQIFGFLKRWLKPIERSNGDPQNDQVFGNHKPRIPSPFQYRKRARWPREIGRNLEGNFGQMVPALELFVSHEIWPPICDAHQFDRRHFTCKTELVEQYYRGSD